MRRRVLTRSRAAADAAELARDSALLRLSGRPPRRFFDDVVDAASSPSASGGSRQAAMRWSIASAA